MEYLSAAWPWVLTVVGAMISAVASAHAVLHKRDPVAAVAWVGLIWLTPFGGGGLLYFVFGINRIQRRAHRLRRRRPRPHGSGGAGQEVHELLVRALEPEAEHLTSLAGLVRNLTGKPLTPGNRIEPLPGGEVAFPAMLQAIDSAQRTLALSTYIFDNDRVGRQFIDALTRAATRGVEVKVLIDDVGVHYSWPTVLRPLRRGGVRVAPFLPKLLPWYSAYANLCNHRKLLIADGHIGFTGGMNIRAGHDLSVPGRHPVQDLHFRIEGPVVAQLAEVFANDWHFSTGELLRGPGWFPELAPIGTVLARGVPSGPDDDFEKLRMTFLGALGCARRRVRIVTPYFLPDGGLIAALNAAALRGVHVDILLPEKSNLYLVQWASRAMLWQVLEHGCRVWLTPPPFDHTKLLLVDDAWVLFGSANWDPRSLRLNFEFDVECYDRPLATALGDAVGRKLGKSRRLALAELRQRSLPVKLRDGLAWLATPYL